MCMLVFSGCLPNDVFFNFKKVYLTCLTRIFYKRQNVVLLWLKRHNLAQRYK